jgi:hypothetical protein
MFRGRHRIKHCRCLDCRVTDGTRRSLVPLEVLDFFLLLLLGSVCGSFAGMEIATYLHH